MACWMKRRNDNLPDEEGGMILKNNIVLIGFMGSGKTSVGIRLSYSLKRTLIDTDKWIEQKQKMTVADIFERDGESAFRRLETECLKTLIQDADRQIISAGGGLPVKEENRKLLKQLGKVFYLKVSPETIYERLKTDTTRRSEEHTSELQSQR